MKVTTRYTDGKATSTGPLMAQMVYSYWTDMLPWALLPFDDVFYLIASIPFHADPPDRELLQRPLYTLTMTGPGGDCDDKSIAMASWAFAADIPWQFVAIQRPDRDRLHHVYPELYIGGRWVPADATYAFNRPGTERPYTNKVILWTHPQSLLLRKK